MKYQRGTAIIETVISLPVLLLGFYAATWAVRVGTVSERTEAAVRYAGVVSAQQDVMHDYSLFALYNNLGNTDAVQTLKCAAPSSLYLSGGALPVVPGTPQQQVVMPSFWLPDSGSVQGYCLTSSGRQVFPGITRSYVLLQSAPNLNATVSDQVLLGLDGGARISSSLKFYRSADVSTIMHCVPALNAAISASLNPGLYGKILPVAPLLPTDFNAAPLPVTANCANAVGSQTPAPTPPPYIPTPGATPIQSPGPGSSSTPQPTPNPTSTATPGNGGSPSPAPTGNTTPTPQPSPHPSGTPTASPSTTPQPSPSPSGPPGNIF